MKNLKNIFTVALIATCMSGCTGFLDIEPETTLTGKNFYKSPDDIRSAIAPRSNEITGISEIKLSDKV